MPRGLSSSLLPACGSLLVALVFLLPGEHAPVNVVFFAMLVLWVAAPGLGERCARLRHDPIFWAFQAYFWVFVIALAWTEDMPTGLDMVGHTMRLALVPAVLLSVVRSDYTDRYIGAYLLGMLVCVALAHYNWLQYHYLHDWPHGWMVDRTPGDTAPFTDRSTYAPMLAWGGYLSARQAFRFNGLRRVLYLALLTAITSNLIFSGGRTGVVAFAVLLVLLSIQHMRLNKLLSLAIGLLIAGGTIGAGYMVNADFRHRIHLAIDEVRHYEDRPAGSVSIRIVLAINSLRAFAQSPVVGVGSGDFPATYAQINQRHTPGWPLSKTSHNQYMLVAVTTGLVGLIALFFVYFPLRLWRLPPDDTRNDLRVALPIWMGLISLFDVYLWRTNTSMVFIVFTCVAYASYSNTDK